MEVALELAALGQPDLDQALARALELVDPRSQLGVEPLVLECEPGRGACRLEQLPLV